MLMPCVLAALDTNYLCPHRYLPACCVLPGQMANDELDRKAREKAAVQKQLLLEQKEVIAGQLELKAQLRRQQAECV